MGQVADSTRSFFPPDDPIVYAANTFSGGYLYTVIDGHGGHTSAHAINLLHGDFLQTSLSPAQSLEFCLTHLQVSWPKPCELVEQCWIRARAKQHDGTPITCGPQGHWGPIDVGVAERHGAHLKRFIEESLSFDSEEDSILKESDTGDLIDPEGYCVISAEERNTLSSLLGGKETQHLTRISSIVNGIRNGFIRLDRDINSAALPDANDASPTEYRASDWTARQMITPHTAQNAQEVKRILSQHPMHEKDFIFRDDRLLGELMPFRAFGDIRLKWKADTLKKVASLLDLPPNYPVCPRFYQSPPYLVCTPQIRWAPLKVEPQPGCNRPVDRFVIIASDGLWDVCTPEEAVQVVASHLADYKNEPWRAESGDTAASRLIRTALGGQDMNPTRISVMLSVPAKIARYYRDDITAMVVYLHSEC
ncbi:[Pyruvate dehydrogenase [acetyl-transferring]]-phosphatase 1, mitochondrial [Cichlidogyrus casuarinus]|uniref:[Pyruvate dehydrogenase [acetyl-transferring]]-phosphatase 1, mitochondrial n=1 Tax=Cichlidogyrus casuarinus TaxID=1844966 RepID=A0ABD2QC73_9PLAT